MTSPTRLSSSRSPSCAADDHPAPSTPPRRWLRALMITAVCAVVGPLFTACPGSLGFDYTGSDGTGGSNPSNGTGGANPGTGGAISFSCSNATTVLMNNCFACHQTASSAFANLDLGSPGVASRLVGVPASTSSSGMCEGKGDLLDSGNLPATGILIDKINFTQTCGSGMPDTEEKMAQTDIDCLQAWANGLVQSVQNGGGN